MDIYVTEIKAIDPATGELCTWCGPHIEAKSIEDARRFCDKNGLGYCKIIGKLHDEISIINTEICQN
jgi:hypothetical protein